MEKENQKKNKQTGLRILFAVVMIALIFLVEMVAIHPTGIYSYKGGYKQFEAGISKEKVLRHINYKTTIRTIRACEPAFVLQKTSRKKLELSPELASSDHWICYDRKGVDYLFRFREDKLESVILQRIRFGKKDFSKLFTQCDPMILKNIDLYLENQDKFKVFYKD